jgi:hypothetical protein
MGLTYCILRIKLKYIKLTRGHLFFIMRESCMGECMWGFVMYGHVYVWVL